MPIIERPGIRQSFDEAQVSFETAINAWRLAMESLRQSQTLLKDCERELEDREAELRFSPIEGANAEQRAAALRLACKRDERWQEVRQVTDTNRLEVQRWTDEANEQKERIALAKRVMDFTVAWLRFRTTEEETNGHR